MTGKQQHKSDANRYTAEFYETTATNQGSAQIIVPLVLDLVRPASVVDVGSGTGAWLKVFREHGVQDVLGVDNHWVDTSRLLIPNDQFLQADLEKPLEVERSFDMAVSLEVAEHLPESSARTFVHSLTSLAPVVVFSAAIPFQGGTHHVNEQWPEYWASLFAEHDFVPVDCIRKTVWNNPDVRFWYAQNMLVYVKRENLKEYPELERLQAETNPAQLSLVHPSKYLQVANPRNVRLKTRIKAIFSF